MGIVGAHRWLKVQLHPGTPSLIRADLYQTSLRLTAPQSGGSVLALFQPKPCPPGGIIRYATRVSLSARVGSCTNSGAHEAGIALLVDPSRLHEFSTTFVGVAFDSNRSHQHDRANGRRRAECGADGPVQARS
jgi:hypothetical protein